MNEIYIISKILSIIDLIKMVYIVVKKEITKNENKNQCSRK